MACGERRPLLAGDVKVTVMGPKGKMAAFWFHTAFIVGGKLRLSKGELDKACKEKKLYHDDFGVEVAFSLTVSATSRTCHPNATPRHPSSRLGR